MVTWQRKNLSSCYPWIRDPWPWFRYIIHLSLLTKTSPNQLHEVLWLLCSEMADETNLSSRLPAADRAREVWGGKLYWWCLCSGFPLSTFLIGVACSFCFVLTSTPSYEASPLCLILCNLFPNDPVGMLKSLRVSLYRFFRPPWPRFPTCSSPWRIFFGKCSSGILVTLLVCLFCANFRTVCTLCNPEFFRTSMPGILSCHLIFRSFLRQLVWKRFSLLVCRW